MVTADMETEVEGPEAAESTTGSGKLVALLILSIEFDCIFKTVGNEFCLCINVLCLL